VVDVVSLQCSLAALPSVGRGLSLFAGLWIVANAPALAAPLGHKGSTIVSGEVDPHWSFFTVTPALTRTTGVGPALHWMRPKTHHEGSQSDNHTGGKGNTSHPLASTPRHPGGSHAGQGAHSDGQNPDQWPHPGGQGPDQGQASSAESSSPGTQELWSLVSLTQRLHRWNGERYQANLWAGAGVGVLTIFHDDGSPANNRLGWSPWAQADWETRRLYLAASARWFQAADIGRLMTSARAGVALTAADYNRWQPWLMVEARTMEGLEEGVEVTPLLRVIHRRILAEAGVSTAGSARFNLTYTF
jgi:hypothetical protein